MFTAFGIAVDAGRDFDDHDTPASPKVIIVNEAFAQRFSPGASPIGQPFTLTFRAQGDYSLGTMTVVGVVRGSVFRSMRTPHEPTVYLPLGQYTDPILTTNFYLKLGGHSEDSFRRTADRLERRSRARPADVSERARDARLEGRR